MPHPAAAMATSPSWTCGLRTSQFFPRSPRGAATGDSAFIEKEIQMNTDRNCPPRARKTLCSAIASVLLTAAIWTPGTTAAEPVVRDHRTEPPVVRDHRPDKRPNHVVIVRPAKPQPDLTAYCKRHYGAGARLTEHSALAWKCYRNTNASWGISVAQACSEQHAMPRASYRDVGDPYSWYCHR